MVKKDETDLGFIVKGSLYILDADNKLQRYGKDEFSKLYERERFNAKSEDRCLGFEYFIYRDHSYLDDTLVKKSSQLLPNDNLTIVCDISISTPKELVSVSTTSTTEPKVNEKREISHLHQDLLGAYLCKEFSDVQLQCGDQVFDCHQFMLSKISGV